MTVVRDYSILKEEAVNLRQNGLSYSEILTRVSVSKSTLSLWLRSVHLARQQHQRLTEKRLEAIKRGSEKIHLDKLERTKRINEKAKLQVEEFLSDSLWLIGTILYWAEGSKEKEWGKSVMVTFSNMDPGMHLIFLKWAKKYLSVEEGRLRYEIYIHKNTDPQAAKKFWTSRLLISDEKIKIYYKTPRSSNKPVRKNTKNNYHGWMRIWISRSSDLNRTIAGWIEGIVKYYS